VPIATAESGPPQIGAGTHELAAAIRGRYNESPPFLSVSCHNHISEVASIDTADDRVGHEILSFAESLVRWLHWRGTNGYPRAVRSTWVRSIDQGRADRHQI
jgi:hypothetical protein